MREIEVRRGDLTLPVACSWSAQDSEVASSFLSWRYEAPPARPETVSMAATTSSGTA
jgi:hypothetical protein